MVARVNRNTMANKMLTKYFESAKKRKYIIPEDTITREIDDIFSSWATGFREVLLVVVIARLLDSNYKASEEFYSCSPRALYEGPIRKVLLQYNVPHGLSGPLNVAKATKGINTEWASQRRPKGIASKTVEIINLIERLNNKELKNLAIYICSKFLDEATRVEELKIEKDPKANLCWLMFACKSLIENTPDRGNTPQKIVGYLLEVFHEIAESNISVNGHKDAASTTNTSSKKPGDIVEIYSDGEILNVYEITVKPFNNQRIEESYSSISSYFKEKDTYFSNVIVICRSQDCKDFFGKDAGERFYLGLKEYKSITYHFINIDDWVSMELMRLGEKGRKLFYIRLNDYISETNTSENVKIIWNSLNKK